MNLTEIIGKQVFEIYTSSFLGTVHDANFDKTYHKLTGLYFFNQDENEYYINIKDIYNINDFITIKNTSKVLENTQTTNNLFPLGKSVVSIAGKDYGTLCDVELNEKFEVTNFCCTNKKITPNQIMQVGTNIVIGDKKICDFRPKTNKMTLSNIKVTLMKMEEDTHQAKLMPTKVTVNSDILIGKKLSKDIVGKNNELILKQNQIITPKHLQLAKQHDKLNELFYSTY